MDHDDEGQRRAFAVLRMTGEVRGIRLDLLDPADEDARRILIEAEHPELRSALEEGREIHRDGEVVNPRMHVSMHESVANQLWDDDPPETWRTAQRLTALGYPRHEVLHMLASVVTADVWSVMAEGRAHDPAAFARALDDLPGSWAELATPPVERHANRAERRAARRGRHH